MCHLVTRSNNYTSKHSTVQSISSKVRSKHGIIRLWRSDHMWLGVMEGWGVGHCLNWPKEWVRGRGQVTSLLVWTKNWSQKTWAPHGEQWRATFGWHLGIGWKKWKIGLQRLGRRWQTMEILRWLWKNEVARVQKFMEWIGRQKRECWAKKKCFLNFLLAKAHSLMRLHCLDILIFPLCTWLLAFAEISTDFIM